MRTRISIKERVQDEQNNKYNVFFIEALRLVKVQVTYLFIVGEANTKSGTLHLASSNAIWDVSVYIGNSGYVIPWTSV
jgi:hypothetical protein